MWKSPDCSSVIWILALSFFGIYLVTHLLNDPPGYVSCFVFLKNQNQNCLCTLFLRIVTRTVMIEMFMHVCIPWYVIPSAVCFQFFSGKSHDSPEVLYCIAICVAVELVLNKSEEKHHLFAFQCLYSYTDMGVRQCLQVTPSSLEYNISRSHCYYTETNQKRHFM